MPRRKLQIEPIECDPITMSDLEEVVKEILSAPVPETLHSENREPTKEEREQRFKLQPALLNQSTDFAT